MVNKLKKRTLVEKGVVSFCCSSTDLITRRDINNSIAWLLQNAEDNIQSRSILGIDR